MSRGMSRAERLREMEHLYSVRAYSDQEMANELSVDRSTAYKDRILLSTEWPFIQNEEGKWRIDPKADITNIRVNREEALVLYLAARRASHRMETAQKPMQSALEKLAVTLDQPMTEQLVKAADQVHVRKENKTRENVFALAAQAWTEGLTLRIRYRGLHGKRSYQDLLTIWFIESSPWSDAVYLIGHSNTLEKTVSYRLDRIERASLSGEPANKPQGLDEQALLRYAWGIWRSDQEPQTVRLLFRVPTAVKRIKESTWHPLEKVTDTEDGGCIWEAPIAVPYEMLPWIRGWGADCEVLEPVELRNLLTTDVRRQAALYGWEVHLPTRSKSEVTTDEDEDHQFFDDFFM